MVNFRKFFLIICVIISIFLFSTGSLALVYINIGSYELDGSDGINDFFEAYVPRQKPVNILLLGADHTMSFQLTDIMMLINFNPSTGNINVMSIPRDTKVKIKGVSVPKINHAYSAGGPEYAINVVRSLLNVDIDYYVFGTTEIFRDVIDELGGVDYNVPINMDYDDPIQNLHIHLKKGMQHLDGAKAEQLLRFRKPNVVTNEWLQYFGGGDLKRVEIQQDFLKEVIRQKANLYTLTKINDLVNLFIDKVDTNFTVNDVLRLARSIDKLSIDKVNTFTLPGNSGPENSDSYYFIDNEKTAELVNQYFKKD